MNFVARENAKRYIRENKNPKVFPFMNIDFTEAIYGSGQYFIAVYNHVEKQYFIALTQSCESYLYNVHRLLSTGSGGACPHQLVKAWRNSDKSHWSFEIYEVNAVNTYEWFQEAITRQGFTELCSDTSKRRNSSRDYDMFIYTDLESGFTRYVSARKHVTGTALTAVRLALTSLTYRYWNRSKLITRKMRTAIEAIKFRTHEKGSYTLKEFKDIPPECEGLSGSAVSRILNDKAYEEWINSEFVRNTIQSAQ